MEPKQQQIEIPVSGKLVYVEDFSGNHGLLAGRFGNLVLLDSDTQTRYAITDDHYYYAYPNLMRDGNSIWFESKRGDNLHLAGLGSNSDIYSINIQSGEIKNIRDSLSTLSDRPLVNRATKWSVSPSEEKVSFVMPDSDNQESLTTFFYLDITKNKLFTIEQSSNRMPNNQIFWSPDEMMINYELGGHSRVYVHNLNSGESRKIHNEFIESVEKPMFCQNGSWLSNSEFVYHCKYSGANYVKVFMYDYNEDVSREIAEIVRDKIAMRSLHISSSGDKLVFIGKDFSMESFVTESSGIYVYDLKSGEMISFAVNNRNKEWMRWYEDL
jgi:Tol biopolymer transport system component